MEILTKSLGHPYADTFNVQLIWTLSSMPEKTGTSCLRVSAETVFLKSTMLKGTIRKNVLRESRESYQILQQLLQEFGGVSGRPLREVKAPIPVPMTPRDVQQVPNYAKPPQRTEKRGSDTIDRPRSGVNMLSLGIAIVSVLIALLLMRRGVENWMSSGTDTDLNDISTRLTDLIALVRQHGERLDAIERAIAELKQ
jgi:hypothetical protein